MAGASLNFDSGTQIAKVNGGDLGGQTLYIDTGDNKKLKKKKLTLPKSYKIPQRKEVELLKFLNDAHSRGIPPEHLQSSSEIQDLYAEMIALSESSSEVQLPPSSTFSILPTNEYASGIVTVTPSRIRTDELDPETDQFAPIDAADLF